MLRLRCADHSDLPYLPDSVYAQTLADNDNNLARSAKICATYILGMLAHKATHRKMGLQLEVWGRDAFESYKSFLLLTVVNPNFMDLSPIPYSASGTALNPIQQFAKDWNLNRVGLTQDQQLNLDAVGNSGGSLKGFGL
jgi:hypothetical protein